MSAFDLSPFLWPEAEQARQPKSLGPVAPYWLARGLYCAYVGGFGDVLNGARAIPADTKITLGRSGILASQATAGTRSSPIYFPRLILNARTELFIQECTVRKMYGAWIAGDTPGDSWSGEYSNAELGWTIHGAGWAERNKVFDAQSPLSLVGAPRTICGVWNKDKNSGFGRVFVDGREVVRTSGTAQTVVSNRTHSTAGSVLGAAQSVSGIALFLAFSTDLEPAEVRSLSQNPWQIFTPQPIPFILDSSGVPAGAELAANAQSQTTVTGTLTLRADLEGAALAVTTASGALSTQIPLVGSAVSVATASGQLLTEIPLTAAALAQVLAAGNLSTQIRLDGAALAQVAASAGLTSAILLAATPQVETTVSGTLAADPGGLAGDAHTQTTVVATLTTSIRLSGSAAVQAGVNGVLTTSIPLTAAALATAIATGTLTTRILLAGDVAAISAASGTLSTQPIDAPGANYRLNASVRRLTTITHTCGRLSRASTAHRRLTTLTHGVRHA